MSITILIYLQKTGHNECPFTGVCINYGTFKQKEIFPATIENHEVNL